MRQRVAKVCVTKRHTFLFYIYRQAAKNERQDVTREAAAGVLQNDAIPRAF